MAQSLNQKTWLAYQSGDGAGLIECCRDLGAMGVFGKNHKNFERGLSVFLNQHLERLPAGPEQLDFLNNTYELCEKNIDGVSEVKNNIMVTQAAFNKKYALWHYYQAAFLCDPRLAHDFWVTRRDAEGGLVDCFNRSDFGVDNGYSHFLMTRAKQNFDDTRKSWLDAFEVLGDDEIGRMWFIEGIDRYLHSTDLEDPFGMDREDEDNKKSLQFLRELGGLGVLKPKDYANLFISISKSFFQRGYMDKNIDGGLPGQEILEKFWQEAGLNLNGFFDLCAISDDDRQKIGILWDTGELSFIELYHTGDFDNIYLGFNLALYQVLRVTQNHSSPVDQRHLECLNYFIAQVEKQINEDGNGFANNLFQERIDKERRAMKWIRARVDQMSLNDNIGSITQNKPLGQRSVM